MIALDYPVNALVSFHYYKEVDVGAMARAGLRMIGDSGAFSAFNTGTPIDIDAFAAWTKCWQHSLAWVASLDVINDAEGTWRNYRTLRDRYKLDVIPTVHYGSDPTVLDRYAADGVDFLGLGGMVGRKGQPKHLLRWCLSMFRYQRDHYPGMRFHGWGVTHPVLLNSLPWYSVDSSGTSAAYRYGRLVLYDPAKHKNVQIAMDGVDVFKHATLLRKHYNVRPAEIASSSSTTRPALIRAAARSNQFIEAELRRKFNVSPPSYGIYGATAGPSIHLVLPTALAKDGRDTRPLYGPHVHTVMSPGARNVDPICGPHVHTVLARGGGDVDDRALMRNGNHPEEGPHIHFVDTYPPHLVALTEE